MAKYLDSNGLLYLWRKIKEYVDGKTVVTGVKGSAESAYRTGQVSLTAANVGAAAASHTHVGGDITSAVANATNAANAAKVNNHTVNADVPSDAKFTDTTYDPLTASEANTGTSTTARTISAKVLADYVAAHGGDTPFPLDITDPDIDLSTTPSEARYDQTLRGLDANGDIIWAVDSVHDTSGAHGFQLNSFGGDNQNSLQMLMKPDGTAAMWISQPAVWRSALGAAASSHNHAASNITSGVLATARGGVPTGGTTGQVLAKTSNSNNDVGWVTPSGGGGGLSIELLWTNPNPTSNFAAQTLSNIPWQNYKFLFIDHYTAGNRNVAAHYETSVISTDNPSDWSWITCIREVPFGRGVKFPANNQVQFGSQTYYETYNGANATMYDDWQFIVPTKIWGVKDGGGTSGDVDWAQSTYADGYYMRRGKFVSIHCESYGTVNAPKGSYASVFTLPEGFRPYLPSGKEILNAASPLGGSSDPYYRINAAGEVSVGTGTSATSYWAFDVTFPCE